MRYLVKDINTFPASFYENHFRHFNLYQKRKINKLKSIEEKKLSILGLVLVAQELNIDVSMIQYCKGVPYVRGKQCFSISHKNPYVGVVIDDTSVGIDIEILRELDEATKRFLNVSSSIEALILWTRKESSFKCGECIDKKVKTILLNRKIVLSICTSSQVCLKRRNRLLTNK